MTSYMPILPIGMFGLFDECKVKDAFILPQLWSNEAYREFYKSRKWSVVIIDNAFYELGKSMEFESLVAIADEVTSTHTFIVAPEVPKDGKKTADAVLSTIAAHGPFSTHWHLMAVFQGDPADMYHMYDVLSSYDIGFAIPVSMYRDGWSRSGLHYFVGIRNHYVHAFGLDDVTEIPDLIRAGINSFDSSIVATAAVGGVDLLGKDLRIVRRGLPSDVGRVDLLQTSFDEEVVNETACNIDDINNMASSIKIEARKP